MAILRCTVESTVESKKTGSLSSLYPLLMALSLVPFSAVHAYEFPLGTAPTMMA